ncbi:hypothetical protein SDC9_104331 [bioreactor metagenome]|uniref:Uncharacterized protein n=1 Tax=bioreactor metagenome TaxID=1076179 RepID=A0A645AWN1_9ZZZZ
MFFHDIGHIIRGEAGIMDPFWVDHHLRTVSTTADARGFEDLNLIDQSLCDKFILEGIHGLMGTLFQAFWIDTK